MIQESGVGAGDGVARSLTARKFVSADVGCGKPAIYALDDHGEGCRAS
jgi:hypothetical protein